MWEIKFRLFYLALVVIGGKKSVRTCVFPALGASLVRARSRCQRGYMTSLVGKTFATALEKHYKLASLLVTIWAL